MTRNIIMPKASLTMEEGLIQKWYVKEGDYVKKGQVIFEIETDKTSMEIEIEYDGYIKRILSGEGETVPVTANIAYMVDTEEELKSSIDIPGPKESFPADIETNPNLEQAADTSSITEADIKHRIAISPVAKKMALDYNLDYSGIKGSGPNGKITKEDIENELKLREGNKQQDAGGVTNKTDQALKEDLSFEEASNFRKIVAKNMSASNAEVPHYYVTMKIDATEMVNFRDKAGKYMRDNNKSPLPFSAILIKIVANAIEQHPVYQSYFHDNRIYKYPSINIGLAVDMNDRLMVPVIKDAYNKRLTQIAQETTSLIDKCRQNKITADDLSEGCFTISNLGMYDVDNFTAIISKEQSGILALGKIKEEPVVINGGIEVRKILTATLSSDHRLIDGSKAANFLKTIKDHIENIYLF